MSRTDRPPNVAAMTWPDTHARYRIIREVVAAADADPTGTLPWREEYAALFGDRAGLLAALQHRWQRTCQAQLDSRLPEEALDERHRELRRRNAGVLRILDRYAGARVATRAESVPRAS
jgi:hypothetical protein